MRAMILMAVTACGLVVPCQGALAQARGPLSGSHGTSVNFLGSVGEAALKAQEEKKLVMLVHVSGMFEDPAFT